MFSEIKNEAALAAKEIIDAAGLKKGDILVVGCSSRLAGQFFREYMRL